MFYEHERLANQRRQTDCTLQKSGLIKAKTIFSTWYLRKYCTSHGMAWKYLKPRSNQQTNKLRITCKTCPISPCQTKWFFNEHSRHIKQKQPSDLLLWWNWLSNHFVTKIRILFLEVSYVLFCSWLWPSIFSCSLLATWRERKVFFDWYLISRYLESIMVLCKYSNFI